MDAASKLAGTLDQLLYTAQFDKIVETCQTTLATTQTKVDRTTEVIALCGLATARLYLGEFQEARTLNNDAIDAAQSLGDDLLLARALMLSGDIHMMATYQAYEANDDYRAALRLVNDDDHPALTASILTGIANFLLSIGEQSRAQRYAREAFEIAREREDWLSMTEALYALGSILVSQEQYESGLKALRDAKSIAQEHNLRLYESVLQRQLGLAYVNSNRHYNEGIALLEEALTLAQAINCVPQEFTALYALGVTCLNQGQLDAAQDYYDTMLQRAQTWRSREYEGTAFFNLGTLYLVDNRYDDALDSYSQSGNIAQETKNPFYEARAEQALALVHRSANNYSAAITHYQAARSIYLALDNDVQARDMLRAIVLAYVMRVVDRMLQVLGLQRDPATIEEGQDDSGDADKQS